MLRVHRPSGIATTRTSDMVKQLLGCSHNGRKVPMSTRLALEAICPAAKEGAVCSEQSVRLKGRAFWLLFQ